MGKYVSIQIVNNCTECQEPGINLLNLAEVEIYGYLAKWHISFDFEEFNEKLLKKTNLNI